MAIINTPVKKKSYRGFSTIGRPFGNWRLTDLDLIKRDILNHFQIRQGEKLENPSFGSIVWNVLFEPFDQTVREALEQDILNVLSTDTRLSIDSVDVNEYDQGIQIQIKLTYSQYNQSDTFSLAFDRNLGLVVG